MGWRQRKGIGGLPDTLKREQNMVMMLRCQVIYKAIQPNVISARFDQSSQDSVYKSYLKYPLQIQQFMLRKANEHLLELRYNEAITMYNDILANKDNDQKITLAALYNMADAYDKQKQFTMAANNYHRILSIDPNYKTGQIYYELGQVLQQNKSYQQSIKAYLKYLQRYPNHPECNFNLALIYEIQKIYHQAYRYYQKAYTSNPAYTKAYRQQIIILIKQSRYKEVIPICEMALKAQPNDSTFYYYKGFSYLKLKKFSKAQKFLELCIQLDKKQVRAYIALAEAKCMIGDNSGLDVLRVCQKINAINPAERIDISYWSGVFLMRMGKHRQAAQQFKNILRYKPEMEGVKTKLVKCLELQGNIFFKNKSYIDALRCYSEAHKYDMQDKVLLNNMGLVHQHLNNFIEAENCFRQVLLNYPNEVRAMNNLAVLEQRRGNMSSAQQFYSRVLKEKPQNYEAHLGQGKLFMSMHNYQQAIKEYKIAENIKSDDIVLCNDMAVALENLGDYQEALLYANKANELTKELSPLILVNRASILMKLNRKIEASQDLNQANIEMRKPHNGSISELWLNNRNRRFIENQLERYACLMNPIKEIRQEIFKEEQKCNSGIPPESLTQLKDQLQNFQEHVMNQLVRLIKEQVTNQVSYKEAEIYSSFSKQLQRLKEQLQALKQTPQKTYEKKLEQLQKNNTIGCKYAKQLFWQLYNTLIGYILVQGGVVAAGANINRSNLNSVLQRIGGISENVEAIPVVGQFFQPITRICRFFVGLQDDVIIKKVYQIISHNYSCQSQVINAIYDVVICFVEDSVKMSKVQYHTVFKPEPQGILNRFRARIGEIAQWFQDRRNEFIMYLRDYKNVQDVRQAQLALIDVGLVICMILQMENTTNEKRHVLREAAKEILEKGRMENMIFDAFQKYQESNRNIEADNSVNQLTVQATKTEQKEKTQGQSETKEREQNTQSSQESSCMVM